MTVAKPSSNRSHHRGGRHLGSADESPASALGDVAQLLDVDMDKRARPVMFVSADRFPGADIDVGQPIQSAPHQDRMHGSTPASTAARRSLAGRGDDATAAPQSVASAPQRCGEDCGQAQPAGPTLPVHRLLTMRCLRAARSMNSMTGSARSCSSTALSVGSAASRT